MRPAPAWIAWAALAAAAAGCCRMQPPSAVDSLESTWTRLREGKGKPSPSPAPAADTIPGPDLPAGPPPEPVSAEGAPARPRPIPLTIPPASGERKPEMPGALAMDPGPAGVGRAPAGTAVPFPVGGAGAPVAGADRATLEVGGSSAARVTPSAVPLPMPAAGPVGETGSLRAGLHAPGSGAIGSGGAAAPLEVGGVSAGPGVGSLLRQESFLPPPAVGSPLSGAAPRPLVVTDSTVARASVATPPIPVPVGAAVSRPAPGAPLPAVPASPAADTATAAATPPAVGKAPALLGAPDARDPATVLPSAALDRAASGDPDAEALRRRRAEAALREREAEAGVLRQFLRRVLRLDPAGAPASAEPPVSEPGR